MVLVIIMSEISSRLQQAFVKKEYSYGELSKITGIPKSAIQRYVTGETEKIPLDRLEKMAAALGVSSSYLMGWDDPVLTDAERDAEMAALLDTLSKREDMRMLFKLAQDATPEDVRAAVKIIEALREK